MAARRPEVADDAGPEAPVVGGSLVWWSSGSWSPVSTGRGISLALRLRRGHRPLSDRITVVAGDITTQTVTHRQRRQPPPRPWWRGGGRVARRRTSLQESRTSGRRPTGPLPRCRRGHPGRSDAGAGDPRRRAVHRLDQTTPASPRRVPPRCRGAWRFRRPARDLGRDLRVPEEKPSQDRNHGAGSCRFIELIDECGWWVEREW
jgi:hypothetical protein